MLQARTHRSLLQRVEDNKRQQTFVVDLPGRGEASMSFADRYRGSEYETPRPQEAPTSPVTSSRGRNFVYVAGCAAVGLIALVALNAG